MKPTDSSLPPTHYLDWSTRGASAIWRYLVAIVLGYVIWLFGAVPEAVLLPEAFTNPANRGFMMQWGFLPGMLGLLLLVRLVLGRPAYSILSPAWPLRVSDFLVGLLIGCGIAILMVLLDLPFTSTTYVGFGAERDLGSGRILLILSGFVVQTAYEELYYRGLILQFAWRIKAWLPFALALQAIVFAVPHFGNVSAWNGYGILAVLPYFIIATSWGWVAWRTGSLLVSMGLHFANNAFLVLAVGTKGDIVVPYAPLTQEAPSLVHGTIGIFVQAVLTIIAVELWLRWKHR